MNVTIERLEICARSRQSARGLRMALLGLACLTAVNVAASAQTTEVVLHTFCSLTNCADGDQPNGVIRDSQGNLYGGTLLGGVHGKGVAYKLAPSGQETVLYNFCSLVNCSDGAKPGALIRDSEGNLYGSAGTGTNKNPGNGLVFKVDISGNETVLCSFGSAGCPDGSGPSGVIMDSEGNLYGTTADSGGIVFKLEP